MKNKLLIDKVLFTFVLTILSVNIWATSSDTLQNAYYVPKLEFENNTYKKVLNKVLSLDQECIYFTPSLEYGIWLINCKDTLFITIEGGSQQGKPFRLKKIMGVLKYKNHDFFVYGDSLPNAILRRSNKNIRIIVPDNYTISEDDSHSMHYFCVYNSYCYYLKSVRRGLKKK
ncbi:MAG: hypothetical protein PHP34_03220 [Bacteroidales bacterium]|nr:hypothetical protein [Bacteroidales bacterium]